MNDFHTSVLLEETIDLLQVKSGKKYIDGTVGGGGHAGEILKHGGIVLGLDVDQEALDYIEEKIKNQRSNLKNKEDFVLVKGNFKDIDRIARERGFEKVAGILLDIGVSSHHFDSAERGFSFQKEGPLDMRMDQELKIKAS